MGLHPAQAAACLNASVDAVERLPPIGSGLSGVTLLAGRCDTLLTAIEQAVNGLLSDDRQPKVAPQRVAAINAKAIARMRTNDPSTT